MKKQAKKSKRSQQKFCQKPKTRICYVFLNKKTIRDRMNIIQSKLHEIGTYEVSKISFILF